MSSPSVPPQPSLTIQVSSSQESLISYLRRNFFTLEPSSLPHYEESDNPNYIEMVDNNNSNNSSLTQNEYIDLSYHSSDEDNRLYPSYVDFRSYPLTIDWSAIENADNNCYDIYDVFGCFGIATFTMLSEIQDLMFEYNDFIYSVLNYFHKAKTTHSYECVLELFQHLPQLNVIKSILAKGMVNKKEIVIIKIVLDLYEMFVMSFCCFDTEDKNLALYIQTATLFYRKCLSDKDVLYIYEIISKEMKRTFKLLKRMGCSVCKRKKDYLNHIKELKCQYIAIVKGLDKKNFIL